MKKTNKPQLTIE